MTDSLLKEAMKLTPAERLELIEQIWDSLEQDSAFVQLTPAQDAELDRRLGRLEATGPQGESWDVVEAELQRRVKDYEANPRAGSAWEKVKERLLSRYRS